MTVSKSRQAKAFQKINKTRLSDQIIEQIKTMISDGMLRPGQQLPSERELASILNVSRLPLREALKALEATRVIKAVYGDGYYVCSLSSDSLINYFETAKEETDDEKMYQDIKEARRIVEVSAVELACKRMNEEDYKRMVETINETRDALAAESPERIVHASIDFHRQLIAASHNALLVKMMDCITDILIVGRLKTWDIKKQNYFKSMNEHKAIINAIKSGDAEKAKQLLEEHLNPVY